jgi:hypothetical protein
MSVEFIPAVEARALTRRIAEARQRTIDRWQVPTHSAAPDEWELFFEANASEALGALSAVRLAAGFVVRYRCFGQRGGDLLLRPFVARAGTDVAAVRRLLDWHPPPDSITSVLTGGPTQDVGLLYQHFMFPPTAVGVFEYWLAMQELWASARWVHSHLIASAAELSQIIAADGWEVVHPVEAYEPAVVRSGGGARLAVLIQCPLGRRQITLQQIEVDPDQSLRYADPVLVAAGPRGYTL